MLRSVCVVVLCAAPLCAASLAVAEEDAPPPPELGEFVAPESDASLEPEVTIIQEGESRVEEYRINGKLYMIKVVPTKGFPYYLVDNDGDGNLETRRNDLDPDIVVPRWTLFRF